MAHDDALSRNAVAYLSVAVHFDHDPMTPREWSNLGTIRCWHGRMLLGDKPAPDAPDDPAEFAAWLESEGALYLPVYAYEHGGITVSTGAFSCPWDSGQAGFVYALPDAIREHHGLDSDAPIDDASRENALACMRDEVKTYAAYLEGQVFGYVVSDAKGETLESCWGFYSENGAMTEGEGVANAIVKEHRAFRVRS